MTSVAPPALLTLDDLPRFARPDRRLELVDGHLFVSGLETPFLDRVIANAGRVLNAAGASDDGRRLLVNEPLTIDTRNMLVPDLAVERGPGEALQLVLEVRTDSTERYALGPKRMVYARARVPEFWFLDPRAGSLAIFTAGGRPDYPWPPAILHAGDEARSLALRRPIAVSDLIVT